MLLEQLKELTDCGFVEKKSYERYLIRVEYSLTADMGMKILEALRIMQHIGIVYLKANGIKHILVADLASFVFAFCVLLFFITIPEQAQDKTHSSPLPG